MSWLRPISALVAMLLVLLEPFLGIAQEPVGPRATHPWGRFSPGAWKHIRILSETLDAKGKVTNTSIMDTNSTLEAVSDQDYTVRADVTIEVAGKRYPSQPQIVTKGYHGESPQETVNWKKTGEAELSINGKTIPCEIRSATIQGEQTRRTVVAYFSEKAYPHVLKSQTILTDAEGKTALSTTTVEVLALDMPYKVGADMKNVSFVKTVQTQSKGGPKITLEVTCPDVPGGVVAHTEKETDESGQTVRRSTLELLDYGTESQGDRPLMGRRRIFHNRSRTRPMETPERARRR